MNHFRDFDIVFERIYIKIIQKLIENKRYKKPIVSIVKSSLKFIIILYHKKIKKSKKTIAIYKKLY